MYYVSENFNTLAQANARHILVKALFNGERELTGDHLVDMTVTEATAASAGLTMGSAISSKLTMSLRLPEEPLSLEGGFVEPWVGFDGSEEYCPLGKFYITKVEPNKDKTKATIEAYDGFSKTEEDYAPTIDMPAPPEAVVRDICAQKGFVLEDGSAIVRGEAVTLSRVSNVPQNIAAKAQSKNLFSYPFAEKTLTRDGITFADNGDGTITANGTATARTYFVINSDPNLPVGKYALSGCPSSGGAHTYYMTANGFNIIKTDTGDGGAIEVREDSAQTNFVIIIESGIKAENLVFAPQLEHGETATDFAPYVSDISVKRYGKNLIPYPYSIWPTSKEGLTVTDNGDGSISIRGTVNENTYISVSPSFELPAGRYTLSGVLPSEWSSDQGYALVLGERASQNNAYITVAERKSGVLGLVLIKGVEYNLTIRPQLELGTVSTDYEPYVEPVTHTADENGVINIPSISPTMTLLAPAGVIIEASYNKDILGIAPEVEIGYVEGTIRQYLGWIAGLAGRNAKFNRRGELGFKWYETTNHMIPAVLQYMGGTKKLTGSNVTVHSISSGSKDNVLVAGNGTGFSFENPFMTQEILDGILERVSPMQYTPTEVKWRGNPCIEAGDIVLAEGEEGNFYTVYVMEQTLTIGGGLNSVIKCFGKSETEINFSTSPTEKRLQQVYTNLQNAVKEATELLGGANGGVFEVVDSNGDGVNDGWVIHSLDHRQQVLANVNGIGFSTDGGATHKNAITPLGINATAITTGSLSAERIAVENYDKEDPTKLTDYIRFGEGTITLGKGDSAIILKLENNQVAFYNTKGTRVACFTNNSFEIENLENGQIRFQNFGFVPRPNGNLSFVKLEPKEVK